MNNNTLAYIGTILIMIAVTFVGIYTGNTWQESYAVLTTMCILFITLRISQYK